MNGITMKNELAFKPSRSRGFVSFLCAGRASIGNHLISYGRENNLIYQSSYQICKSINQFNSPPTFNLCVRKTQRCTYFYFSFCSWLKNR